MTAESLTAPTDSYERLADRFRPVFQRIRDGAVDREQQRRLPFDEVRWLKEAGFGAVRVPREFGGAGAGLSDLFRLLVELGEADSNLPQLLRAHVLFVEEQLGQHPSVASEGWLRLVGDGILFGNAVSERTAHGVGRSNTTLTERDGLLVLNGAKFYSTGSLFADWITVRAERGPGDLIVTRVPATAPGVVQHDDWDGFGQRTTGSGTVEFTNAVVDRDHVIAFEREHTLAPAIAQLVLLAALVGVARNATGDVTEFVRQRQRSYSHASASLPKDDPLVQQVVGEVHSAEFAAEATLAAAVGAVHRAQQALAGEGNAGAEFADAELAVSKAQVTIIDLVLPAVTHLFDVGGSSIVGTGLRLDRHWRNARTLAAHNPVIFKSRAVGDHAINGTKPVFAWITGGTARNSGESV